MNARTSTTFDPLVVRTRAMASEIVLTLWDPRRSRLELERSAERVVTMFHQVESECSRFLPSSALSRTNASPRRWHRVPEYLYLALVAALMIIRTYCDVWQAPPRPGADEPARGGAAPCRSRCAANA